MNVYLARDGEELGECERSDLEQLVREGQVQPTDHYWHEGMEQWRLVGDLLAETPAAPPPSRVLKPQQPLERVQAPQPTVRIPVVATPTPAPASEPAAPVGPTKAYRDPRVYLRQKRRTPREAPQPLDISPRFRTIASAVVALLFLSLVIFLLLMARPERAAKPSAPALFSPPPAVQTPTPSESEIRDQATADLKEKIDHLPGKPAPPLNLFYYDVNVSMRRSLSTRTPWWAVIRGREDLVDPDTGKTLVHTDFILTTDYRDGQWTFKHYRASASDIPKEETREVEEDEKTTMPPSIVGMLGLKRPE